MPENMSSENVQSSSINAMRQLGAVKSDPISQFGLDAAKNFPQPEARKEMPDIKMLMDDSGDEAKKRLEAAIANRMLGRGESLNDELIASATTSEDLFRGLRAIESKLESGDIPSNLEENYKPPGQLSTIFNRAECLKIKNGELVKRGWLMSYNPATGEGMPKNRKYSSLAMGTDEQFVIDNQGRYVPDMFGMPSARVVFNFGTEAERETLAKAYDKAAKELEARAIIGEHIGVRLSLKFRDNLEGLGDFLHETSAKFKADHLHALFNMPDIDELALNPENHTLGDRVEEAILCNLIMLNSGSKERIQNFMERSGVKFLIAKMAKEQGGNYNDWVQNNIGDFESWESDDDRLLVDDGDRLATFRTEAGDGRRKKLTMWGNIAAFGGNPGDFGNDDEKKFIEKDIGDLVGSVEASWVAATLMRVIGAYASEGYVALRNGKTLLTLGEGRYVSSDDEGKGHTLLFNYKEGFKGSPSGLKDMIGRIPDIDMNLFDWAQVRMTDLPKKPDGSFQKRSIWDAWLGTAGEKPLINLLTGEASTDTDKMTKEEGYHRLGDLNFQSLDRDFQGTYGVMKWLAYRKDDGIITDALNVEKFGYADFSVNSLKKKVKYIKIVMNPIVLTKGSMQLYDWDMGTIKTIQKNYFSNLMTARVRSACFKTNVLPQEVPVYNESSGTRYQDKVSAASLVKIFIDAVEKNDPKKQEELIKAYVDDNSILSNASEVNKRSMEVVVERKLTDEVGRVIGKRQM